MDDESQFSQPVNDSLDRPAEYAVPGTEDTDPVAVADDAVGDGAGDAGQHEPAEPPPPDLLHELAAAMHATAARERERIEAAIVEKSSARVDQLRERAAAESDELRRLAAQDVERIDEWAAAEVDRIRVEARRRSDERRAALEGYMSRHDASVEVEIGRVGTAVAVYRERLDAFFKEVDGTNDPAAIARLAGSLPEMPDLEDLVAESSIRATPQAPPTAVVADEEANSAQAEAVEEARTELAADTTPDEPIGEGDHPANPVTGTDAPLVGVMAPPPTWSPPAPPRVSPLTAIVSAPPTSRLSETTHETTAEASAEATAEATAHPHHRGAMGLLRTIAPWSRHDDTE